MKRKIQLNDFNESLFSFSSYNKNLFDGQDKNHRKMIESLKNIIAGELTEKQRLCILLYYGKSMKMKEIALELGIGISSVSRHIKKGKLRVKKTLEYYF